MEERNNGYLKWCLLVMAGGLLIVAVFVLENLGAFSRVFIERKIFETSYQHKSALKSEIAVHKATLAEINFRLKDTSLTKSARNSLEAQAASLRIRIRAAEEQL